MSYTILVREYLQTAKYHLKPRLVHSSSLRITFKKILEKKRAHILHVSMNQDNPRNSPTNFRQQMWNKKKTILSFCAPKVKQSEFISNNQIPATVNIIWTHCSGTKNVHSSWPVTYLGMELTAPNPHKQFDAWISRGRRWRTWISCP